MVKIQVESFGAKFNLRCPRCGKDDFKEESYNSGAHKYHHCKTCGADVSAEPHMNGSFRCGLDIGIVVEEQYYRFGE